MSKKKLLNYIKKNGELEFLSAFINVNIKDLSIEDEETEAYMFYTTPKYIEGSLRSYQLDGLNWLINMYENDVNCILADEMGLGKTVQTISLLGYIRFIKEDKSRNLIVVPKSVLQNWADEFKAFCPKMQTKIFWCSKSEIKTVGKKLRRSKCNTIITTYEMCLTAKKLLRKLKFNCLVVDEAHRLKNEESVLYKSLRYCNFKHKILLTGTPLQNNLHELWALLNFIEPDIFHNSQIFESFVTEADQTSNVDKIAKIRKLLSLFFLRREKSQVEKKLLPKKFITIFTQLSPLQIEMYKGILKRDLKNVFRENSSTKMGLLNIVMQLRKCCNHPYLFQGIEKEPFVIGEHIVENSGKLVILDKMLVNLKKNGHRVLLFSQMAHMLDIIEDYLIYKGYEYCRIDGSTSGENRISAISEYNRPNSSKFIFLLTTRAGGMGINLSTADTVIIYDSDWNPYADLQAQDRAHRIGQSKQVQVFRLITEGTIEESIVIKAQQKLKLDDVLIQKREKNASNTLSKKELVQILSEGIEINEAKEDQNKLSIEEIIANSENRSHELQKKVEMFKIGDVEPAKTSYNSWAGRVKCESRIGKYMLDNKIESEEEEEEELPGKRSGLSMFNNRLKYQEFYFPDYQFCPKEFYELQNKEKQLLERGEKLTDEERDRKDLLVSKTFMWPKKDYKRFVAALEQCGDNKEMIITLFSDKSDAGEYFDVFLERMNELEDHDKVERILARYSEKKKMSTKIKEIIDSYDDQEIEAICNGRSKFYYNHGRLLRLYRKHIDSQDCWLKIKADLFSDSAFCFDFSVHTRTVQEISRYISSLVSGLMRNAELKK